MNGLQAADTLFEVPVVAPVAPLRSASPARLLLPTEEEMKVEIAQVLQKQLSSDLLQWVDGYSQVGKRNLYLWKWCRQGVEVTTLSCVAPELFDFACDTKVLGVVLDVLLDDIADRKGDAALLDQLLSLPFSAQRKRLREVAADERAYAEFTIDVWQEIKRRTAQLPRYEKYASLWRYDYLQLFNAMRYSHLINQDIALLNLTEHDMYLPHNMHIMISATVDLMCSPTFNHHEVGRLREAVWNAQCMGRIGNLTTTWERELGDADFTSGVYARAIAEGDVTVQMLLDHDKAAIAHAITTGGHEEYFMDRWAQHRQRLIDMAPQLASVDLRKLLTGYERLIRLHMGSRGYK
jgi:hypothetical protein